jgi:hypothetical protein
MQQTAERRDMDGRLFVAHKQYARDHNIKDPGDMCDHCGEWFTRRDSLQQHLKEGQCRLAGTGVQEGEAEWRSLL